MRAFSAMLIPLLLTVSAAAQEAQITDEPAAEAEQATEIDAMTDVIAERVRKLGGTTLRSIGHISRLQRVLDNDADYVTPLDMLAELRDDNKQLCVHMRTLHELCDEHGDIATASLIENWIDETEKRVWFLFETTRRTEG